LPLRLARRLIARIYAAASRLELKSGTTRRPLPSLVLITSLAFASPASAAAQRFASINMCTDLLLLTLADPQQIAGLGPFARDPHLSWFAQEARRYPQLSGEAEDLLMLRPDVVLAGRYGKRATRELLQAHGVAIAEFDVPTTVDDVKREIRRVGEMVGHPDRAEALIARIDAALVRTRKTAAQTHKRVLPVSRRGWVAGRHSLINSLLEEAGLRNAVSELGFDWGGFAALETIVATHPELVLVADRKLAEDQGQALLLHPALTALYPAERRLVIPEQLTMCGGPMLPIALEHLAAALERMRP
jgi:iron complex transport system substrate-binding protein